MNETDQTFGEVISQARKKLGWSQKELALKILREEDQKPISPQYLNDIEHDRRSPTSDHLVQQFSDVLNIDSNWLYYLAGKFPAWIREQKLTQQEFSKAMKAMVAFRRSPKRK